MTILLIHFAFLIKCKKSKLNKKLLQNVHDDFFKSLEFDIRESGYGDVAVNKKMKDYLNTFYYILNKIHNWDNLIKSEKITLFKSIGIMIGFIGGFILALVTIFKKEWAPTTVPIYAVLKGLALGIISKVYNVFVAW